MAATPGNLYLGRELDPDTSAVTERRLDLPSDQLTTHGVIVGMTGSGKTGLGIVLLEEVLASGVPALVLDPKGDMGNLLLNFPDFRAEDFEPWVDESEARRKGVSAAELASQEAGAWKAGLAEAGVDPARMRGLRDGVDLRILTPGSTAGTPVNLIGDLSPPDVSWNTQGESIRDEIEGLVSGLLVLIGIEADPLTSREHILLSNLVEHAWKEGRSLDLPTLIRQVQDPPLRRLGVFEIDAFYPAKDRMGLAMRLNGLMASPSFAEWMVGEPVDVQAFLFAPDGRPRATIVYLAHLSESERSFVTTLLLTKVITWMRKQAGTSELRALIYADEVAGLAPPTAEPPTKRPILTLYKQARAHGVGLVMATQNPVDLDYKLMSNAGTWMVGRLQTERDKARIIEALRSASGGVDVAEWDARIGGLGKRQFVMKAAKSEVPSLFTTRWAMSYLRGPLTRAEIVRLRGDEQGAPSSTPTPTPTPAPAGSAPALAEDESTVPPSVATGVSVKYLDPSAPWRAEAGIGPDGSRLEAGLAVRLSLLFDERVGDIRHEDEWETVFFPLDDQIDAEAGITVDYDRRDFRDTAAEGVTYVLGSAPIDRADFFKSAEKALEEHLYRTKTLELFRNRELKLYSRPGESQDEFGQRCAAAAEDRADAEAEKLRDRYETKLKAAQRRLAQAERRVRELDVETGQRKTQEMVAGASDLLSMFLGGRRRVRGLSGMSSRRSQTIRAGERLRSAEEKAEERQLAIEELERELADDLAEIWDRWKEAAEAIETFEVPLERTDIRVDDVTLFWAPGS